MGERCHLLFSPLSLPLQGSGQPLPSFYSLTTQGTQQEHPQSTPSSRLKETRRRRGRIWCSGWSGTLRCSSSPGARSGRDVASPPPSRRSSRRCSGRLRLPPAETSRQRIRLVSEIPQPPTPPSFVHRWRRSASFPFLPSTTAGEQIRPLRDSSIPRSPPFIRRRRETVAVVGARRRSPASADRVVSSLTPPSCLPMHHPRWIIAALPSRRPPLVAIAGAAPAAAVVDVTPVGFIVASSPFFLLTPTALAAPFAVAACENAGGNALPAAPLRRATDGWASPGGKEYVYRKEGN